MNPWWALEDPGIYGPDDDGPESTSDDRCTCDLCGEPYEVWRDTDSHRVTYCCETCWAKGEEPNTEFMESA